MPFNLITTTKLSFTYGFTFLSMYVILNFLVLNTKFKNLFIIIHFLQDFVLKDESRRVIITKKKSWTEKIRA